MSIASFHALILGIVQGLAEFLPISSSGHLILVPSFFHWEDPGLAFDVALHLGTLLGVVIYFWKDLTRFAQSLLQYQNNEYATERKLLGLLAIATVPGALIGLALEHKAETVLRSPFLIAWAMIGLGTLLGAADYFLSGQKKIIDLTWKTALLIGIAQGLALIPGVSRSGITITVALALGLQREEAARFSFLMSIPIIAGAGLLKAKQIFLSPDKMALGIGFAASAVCGLIAVSFLMKYVRTKKYTPFVLYRWALGAFVLLNLARFS